MVYLDMCKLLLIHRIYSSCNEGYYRGIRKVCVWVQVQMTLCAGELGWGYYGYMYVCMHV